MLPLLFPSMAVAEVSLACKRYAVAVSRSCRGDGWEAVVRALVEKHRREGKEVRVFRFWSLEEVLGPLRKFDPRYVAFVVPWREATRQFVADVWIITRSLDADPYGDALWGIVTGLSPKDALKLASAPTKLPLRFALLKTAGGWLDFFPEGVFFSEVKKGEMWRKRRDRPVEKGLKGPPDTTEAIVQILNSGRVDIVVTSGHATEHDWQLGYSFKDGQFLSKGGRLFGVDTKGRRFEILSPNPKVYYAPGNCLIGHISDPDCMVLAWIRSGGAVQFCGYTVPTWFGYMGWGMADYFLKCPGRFTFAEAFFLANQALLFDLLSRTPGVDPRGLAHDLNKVAFYGDPGVEARIEGGGEAVWEPSITVSGSSRLRGLFRLKVKRPKGLDKPGAAFLPFKMRDVKVVEAEGRGVVTDDFVLLRWWWEGRPKPGSEKVYTLSFEGERAGS